MKRRLKLLVGTFGFLLAAFLVYAYFSEPAPAKRLVVARDPSSQAAGGARVGGVVINPGKRPEIFSYDKNHRLEARYSADRWELQGVPVGPEKLSDPNSWQRGVKLFGPNIQWFLKTGEVVTITAKLGSMRANTVAGQLHIEEGQLNEDVVVTLDRSRELQRRPLAERPDDAVTIKVDDIRFDNQNLSIQSNSRVVVTSRESDIMGTGLHLDWSEGPRELGELRIDQGESMLIREGGSVVDVSLPGSRIAGGKAADAPGPGASGTAKPAAPVDPAEARVVDGRDLYVATFTNSVNVNSVGGAAGPRRYLRGADEMRVVFEYKSSRSLREGRLGQGPTPAPTSGGAGRTPAPAPITPIVPVTRGTAAKPAAPKPASTQAAQPILVTWKGPLIIKPMRTPESRLPKQVDFAAKGERLELGDSQGTAVRKNFTFTSPGQEGQLVGSFEKPVELTMANGEKVVAPQLDFVRATQERPGKINILGAGTMSMPAGTGGAGASGAVAAASALDGSGFGFSGGGRQDVKIAWTKSVAAVLGLQTGEGAAKRRDFVRKADFVGGVLVQQGTNQRMSADLLNVQFYSPETPTAPANRIAQVDASGNVDVADTVNNDFVKCQSLRVEMALGKDEKSSPQKIIAKGAVAARQQKTEITSDDLTIFLGPQLNDKTGKVDTKPQRLLATGRVKVIDNSGADPVFASCETVDSNVVTRQATLRGTKDQPARVRQKDNDLEGPVIVLDQTKQAADVAGAGRLRVMSNSDLSGNKVAQPRPVDIRWADKMLYRGLDRQAEIVGKVQLDTAEDRINCQTMHILFAPPDPAAKPAAGATSKPTRGMDMQFNPQKIEMVIADKAVEMLSNHKDPDGFLVRGMWLKSDQLVYQAANQQVQCNAPGVLLVEDYRPPAQGKPAAGGDMGIDTSHPAQTVFEWSKSMELQQGPRATGAAGQPAGQAGGSTIRIVGDAASGKPARIKNNSGANIVLADKLPVRPWGKLPPGRTTDITCDVLTAEFAPAPPNPKADPNAPRTDADSGPRMGPLESFDAKGHVNLLDGTRQALCQRIAYTRKSDTAVLYGSLPGEKPKNVVIYFQDPQKGQVQSMAPTFVWTRADNHIEAKDIEAVGGR